MVYVLALGSQFFTCWTLSKATGYYQYVDLPTSSIPVHLSLTVPRFQAIEGENLPHPPITCLSLIFSLCSPSYTVHRRIKNLYEYLLELAHSPLDKAGNSYEGHPAVNTGGFLNAIE
ncbi:hypothetical protein R3P38DRAFT_3134743 [Favolaschia claudopus]|uniref:Uncharacterized protein n=1 Tax=Favolaschia claudopus TaxID=2862362 RepID=A0AAV9Z757_9AGAR